MEMAVFINSGKLRVNGQRIPVACDVNGNLSKPFYPSRWFWGCGVPSGCVIIIIRMLCFILQPHVLLQLIPASEQPGKQGMTNHVLFVF